MTSFLLPAGHKTLEQDEDGQLYWQMQEFPAFIFYVDDIPEQNLKKTGADTPLSGKRLQ